jgi:hypothetical protein
MHLPIVQETVICCSDETEAITRGLSSLCLISVLGPKCGGPLPAVTPGALQAEPQGGTWRKGDTAAISTGDNTRAALDTAQYCETPVLLVLTHS